MRRQRYFTPVEVAAHNTAEDLWVSFRGKVFDLTPLIDRYRGDVLLLPIMEAAGKDISSWFDPETEDVLRCVDPLTQCERYFTPRGRFVHVPPSGPRSDWASDFVQPWWRDQNYQVGQLTTRTRTVRFINTLTAQETTMEVCSEETLAHILHRYRDNNSHASSYTWKHEGVTLDMDGTLSQNGIHDDHHQLDQDLFTPAILLYFNDDLTEA